MRLTIIVAFGTLLLAGALGTTAFAQATSNPPAPETRTPQGELFLKQLMNPARPQSAGSFTRDDLQNAPPPRPDTLKDVVHIHSMTDDPRCLPGEDSMLDRLPGRRGRRR